MDTEEDAIDFANDIVADWAMRQAIDDPVQSHGELLLRELRAYRVWLDACTLGAAGDPASVARFVSERAAIVANGGDLAETDEWLAGGGQ